MIALSIDPAMATIVAAVVALIGTFVANTYATVIQARQNAKEQDMRLYQAYTSLFQEMGYIIARLLVVLDIIEV